MKTKTSKTFIRLTLPLIWATAMASGAFRGRAQMTTSGAPTTVTGVVVHALSAQSIQLCIDELSASPDLEQNVRTNALALYQSALKHLDQAGQVQTAADQFTAGGKKASDAIKTLNQALKTPLQKPENSETALGLSTMAASDLEKRLNEARTMLTDLDNEVTKLDAEIMREHVRPEMLHKELTDTRKLVQDLQAKLTEPPPGQEAQILTNAREVWLRARLAHRNAQCEALDHERLSHKNRFDLLKLRKEMADRQCTEQEALVQLIQKTLNERRIAEAAKAQRKAETMLNVNTSNGAHPMVVDVAGENAELSQQLTDVAAALERAVEKRTQITLRKRLLEQRMENLRLRLQLGELSDELGEMFRRERRRLKRDMRQRLVEKAMVQALIEAQIQQLKMDTKKDQLYRIDELIAGKLAKLKTAARTALDRKTRDKLETALQEQRKLVDQLLENLGSYIKELRDGRFEEQELDDKQAEYSELLDEKLIWLPSSTRFGRQTVSAIPEALDAISRNARTMSGEFAGLKAAWYIVPVILLSALVMLLLRQKAQARITYIAGLMGRPTSDSFAYTLEALGWNIATVPPWFLLPAGLGWICLSHPNTLFDSLGFGLLQVARILYTWFFLRIFFKDDGLTGAHFRWRPELRRLMTSQLDWLMPAMAVLGFIVTGAYYAEEEVVHHAIGRTAFIASTLLLLVFSHRLMHPQTGLLSPAMRYRREGWLYKSRFLWHIIALALPAALMLGALSGYYYSALQLSWVISCTLRLVFSVLVLRSFALRWLRVIYRRTIYQKAREKAADSGSENVADEFALKDPDLDIYDINEQTYTLIRWAMALILIVGLAAIWADIIPAFGILDNIQLWTHFAVVEGVRQPVPVTLSVVGFAALVLALTFVLAANLPGLCEIVVLQRIIELGGTRYAVRAIISYVIGLTGILYAVNIVGFGWAKMQWLVAALSVGLGFGLQEIFANFISGLILLFERPIRVGDIVTIGDTTGVVSRIRIRATMITDWDRKEYIVPNKELITGRVLNWTLSNQINRIVIVIGVAYGSDVQKALQLLREVAEHHPLIMKDPAPLITFEGFGDNALNLVLRCYLPDLDQRLNVVSQLHNAIDQAYRKAGIEIAFPQQDLHIRSVSPQAAAVLRGNQ